jgi:hypothetical protein
MIDIHAPRILGRPVIVSRPGGRNATGKIMAVRGDYVHVQIGGTSVAAAATDCSWPDTGGEVIPMRK